MKTYVINLDRNEDRLALITKRLDDLGVPFERVSAIYGKELSEEEKHNRVSFFRWWCVRGAPPRDGEIGAVLSHQKVYHKLLKSGDPCCCVLEDDDHFDPRFKTQLERVEKWIDPRRPQVVLLTNYTKRDGGAEWRIVRSDGDSSAEAYVITSKAAKALLDHNVPACMPSDVWRFWARRRVIELYHAFPTVVPSTWQLPGYRSDVCPEGEKVVRVSEMGTFGRVAWKLKRLIGISLARIIIR